MAYSEKFEEVLSCIPLENEEEINWIKLEKTHLGLLLCKMRDIQQEPEYHGEGDVYCHTKAVCEELIKLPEYISSSKQDKIILFLSALLHDTGKIKCTKTEDGKIIAPSHASKGALMVREMLWKDFGLCGSEEKQQLRESICLLVQYHSFPPHAIGEENPEYKILSIASAGELAKSFSIKKLCILSVADVLGRQCSDQQEYLERIEYCRMLSQQLGCEDKPYPFKNAHSKRAYFLKKTRWRDNDIYNSTWGKVIMLSGLPGTGKDTWISKNCPTLPMISLDEIRKELKVLPTDSQGKVIAAAQERAKEYLRAGQPFLWNATDITQTTRAKWISLFEQYGAAVEVVFLETDWDKQLERNDSRKEIVPVGKIEDMLSKLETPQSFECERVIWEIS